MMKKKMKNKKKVFLKNVLALLVMVIFCLTACGDEVEQEANTTALIIVDE